MRNPRGKIAALAVAALMAFGLTAVQPPPAQAYNVCSDDQACVHEKMSALALGLLAPGSEAALYAQDIWDGAGHEDGVGDPPEVDDHIYGYPYLPILKEAVITMPHFWDSDVRDDAPSTYGDFEDPIPVQVVEDMWNALDILDLFEIGDIDTSFIVTPNAWQKAQHFWTLALGAYAANQKDKAFEYLGHIVHFLGDMTVPTHAHGDAHVDLFGDEDPYEEWMSNSTPDRKIFPTDDEWIALRAAEANTGPGPMNGPLDGNVPAGVDPLYYLLYTTNQLSDFFTSRDVDGDTVDRNGWMQGRTQFDGHPHLQPTRPGRSRQQRRRRLRARRGHQRPRRGSQSDPRGHLHVRHPRIAALYRHFEATVRQPTLTVGIDYVEDSDDWADTTDDADFFGKVTVNGKTGQNRGEEKVDQEVVTNPGWAYGATAPSSGTVPVHVEIWDEDGESPLVPSLNFGDDLFDINGGDSDNIDLQVDMAKCITGQAGAISGDLTGACGQVPEGEQEYIEVPLLDIVPSPRAKVRFRIFLNNLPPVANAGPDVQTPEGTDLTLDGSASFDPEGKPLTYSWDLDGDGICDDSSGTARPTFTQVGNDGTTVVKVCVADEAGMTDEDTAVVTVTNVAPAIEVSDPAARREHLGHRRRHHP